MADAELPSSWVEAGRQALGHALWILPLLAGERAFEGHFYQTGIAALLWLMALYIAIQLHVLHDLFRNHGRRKHLLTWALIIGGAISLSFGIYRLATQPVAMQPAITHDPPAAGDITKATAPIQAEVERLNRALAAAQSERENARTPQIQGAIARGPDQSAQSRPTTHLITWYTDSQLVVVSGGASNAMVHGILIMGKSNASVTIKEAFAISGLSGRKQNLMANVQSRGAYYAVDKVDIPPDAPVQLDLIFNPPLPLRDFLDQWGKFHVTIIYNDGTSYDREYEESYVRKKLQEMAPSAFGPRMTPRDDSK